MSNMAFFAADTLGMTLYQMNGHLESSEIRPIRLGPWQVDMKIDVMSDLVTGRGLTFWIRIGALRLYLIVRDKESWLIALDEAVLKECGAKTGFAAATIPERLDEFESAIKQQFHWREDQNRWVGHTGNRWWWKG